MEGGGEKVNKSKTNTPRHLRSVWTTTFLGKINAFLYPVAFFSRVYSNNLLYHANGSGVGIRPSLFSVVKDHSNRNRVTPKDTKHQAILFIRDIFHLDATAVTLIRGFVADFILVDVYSPPQLNTVACLNFR